MLEKIAVLDVILLWLLFEYYMCLFREPQIPERITDPELKEIINSRQYTRVDGFSPIERACYNNQLDATKSILRTFKTLIWISSAQTASHFWSLLFLHGGNETKNTRNNTLSCSNFYCTSRALISTNQEKFIKVTHCLRQYL